MKVYDVYKSTSNRTLYNKARKRWLDHAGKINCSLCPYNKGENSNYHTVTNWKKYRKTQYKTKAC